MKFTIPTKLLQSSLARIASIPGAHGAAIHTQAVKVSADMGGLTLSRFTSEARLSLTLDQGVEIEDEGEIFVTHAGLSSLASACGGKEIIVESDEKNLNLASGRGHWKVRIFDESAMTEEPAQEKEATQCDMEIDELIELLSFALPATNKESAGGTAMCGINIRQHEGATYFIATDGRRCHIAISAHELDVNAIIPNEGVDAILKAASGASGKCTLCIGDNSASVIADNLEISVRLLDEQYPNVIGGFLGQVEASKTSTLTVSRDEMAGGLDSCAKINSAESRIVTVKIERKSLEVNGGNSRDSEGKITLDCEASEKAVIGVAGANLAASLKMMGAEEDGSIAISYGDRFIFVKQPDRMMFFATAKPSA